MNWFHLVIFAIYFTSVCFIFLINRKTTKLMSKYNSLRIAFVRTTPRLENELNLYRLTKLQGYNMEHFQEPINKIMAQREALLDEMDKVIDQLKPTNFLKLL